MNCATHPEAAATAFCRDCGKALCEICQVKASGTIFCEEHKPKEPRPMETTSASAMRAEVVYGSAPAPRQDYASPYTAPQQQQAPPSSGGSAGPLPHGTASPGLAFILGWIPGVGAIYNGQYAKGLVHVVVFGLLISIIDHSDGLAPLVAMMLTAWIFYMAFEAYHTAKRRNLGLPVDEMSSLVKMDAGNGRVPVGPIILIGAGFFFLLANFDLIRIRDVIRFWPLGLVGLGAYMLVARLRSEHRP